MIGTLRRECLDHVIVVGERHARAILEEYVEYYNAERAHRALERDSPMSRAIEPGNEGEIVARSHLGKLHHSYRRAAWAPFRPGFLARIRGEGMFGA